MKEEIIVFTMTPLGRQLEALITAEVMTPCGDTMYDTEREKFCSVPHEANIQGIEF